MCACVVGDGFVLWEVVVFVLWVMWVMGLDCESLWCLCVCTLCFWSGVWGWVAMRRILIGFPVFSTHCDGNSNLTCTKENSTSEYFFSATELIISPSSQKSWPDALRSQPMATISPMGIWRAAAVFRAGRCVGRMLPPRMCRGMVSLGAGISTLSPGNPTGTPWGRSKGEDDGGRVCGKKKS